MRRQLFALTLSLGLFAAISPTHAQKPAPGQTAKPKPPLGPGPTAAKPPKAVTAAPTKPSLAATSGVRLTARAPDAMVAGQKARALAGNEAEALAALATLEHLSETSTSGTSERALAEVYKGSSNVEVKYEAALAARRLSAEEGTDAAYPKAHALGLLTDVVVVGPFRDTGGGLDTKEGPEKDKDFGYPKGSYSWGVYDVSLRPVRRTHADARGVPLDLYVSPRRESCSYVATKVFVDKDRPLVVRAASTGQVRVTFDGQDVARADDVHETALFDRVAARVDATKGPHLVAAKVCSGALDDDGRVRLRLTDEAGEPVALPHSQDLSGVPEAAKKLVLRREETALTRAMKVTAKSADDAILSAVVLGTLGGADDKKSPRVPGLLDTFVRRAVSPDALGLAAWVSPFGANRSGWLEDARRKAVSANDEETLGFVERRLLAERIKNGHADWANALVKGMKLDADPDDEALLLRAEARRALGTEALAAEALRAMADRFQKNPKGVPDLLLRRLTELSLSSNRALYMQVRAELERRGDRGSDTVHVAIHKGKPELLRAARAAIEGGATDDDQVIEVAAELLRAGHGDEALAAYKECLGYAPNRSEVYLGLAQALALTGKGNDADMAKLLARARALSPGEARLRAELELRAKAEAQKGREDEKHLVKDAVFLARRKGVTPEVADRELHWLRAVVMHQDRRVSQLIHYAREIVVAPRTQDELFEDIPQEGDLVEILRARVHRKDGSVSLPAEEHNEGARPRIRWPDLYPGDTVEVAVRTWTAGPVGGRGDAPYYFLDYAGAPSTHPLLYNEVVVDSPKDTPIHLDVLRGGDFQRDERDEGNRHVVRLVWQKPMVVADEPLSPAMSEVLPLIVGSTFRTWDDFRKWYKEAVRGFTEPDEEVKRLALELTKNKKTKDEKIRALFDFVADDIRYVNYVSGEWWLPNRPQQLLARREGDCDDKAILLITLLRVIGVEAQEVLVQTRLTGMPSVLSAKNAAVPMFDHGIAFMPGPNGGTYLDATSPESRMGPLPSMDARATALRLDAGTGPVVLPSSSPDDHGSEVEWTITIGADGSAELEGAERHRGDGGFWLRTNLTQKDARAQYVEDNLVGPWVAQVEVDKNIDFKGDLPNGEAKVSYKAKSLAFARREQADLVIPLSQSIPLAAQLAPLVTRTLPMVLPPHMAPNHQTRVVKLVAPPNMHFAEPPPGGKETGGELGHAELSFTKDPKNPRVLVVKRNVVLDQHVIPTEKYPAFRAFIQRVDALMHKSVRIERGEK
ncbi:MAG: transglutaminase domain-containing protein [Polyangiaceae bacterium]